MIKNLVTWSLVIAGLFQLSLLGVLPEFGYKPIGDVILLGVLFLTARYAFRPFDRSLASRCCHFASIFFTLFVVFLLGYSIILWPGQVLLTVRWARRWLVAGTYLILVSSQVPRLLNWKILHWAVWGGALATVLIMLADRYGYIDLAGTRIVGNVQGMVLVTKTFNPGSLLIVAALLLSIFNLRNGISLSKILLIGFWGIMFVWLISFRAWWIFTLFVVWLTPFLIRVRKLSAQTLKFLFSGLLITLLLAVVVVGVFSYALASEGAWADKIKWVYSAFEGALDKETDTSAQYRYIQDISRLVRIYESDDILFQVFGIGFVAQDSVGYRTLGFSSETNDSGWVEVLLTGGWVAAISLTVLWLSHLLWLRKLCIRTQSAILSGMLALWIVGGLLMSSSNPLLWDFGFVPLAWIYLFALAQFDHKKSFQVAT